MRLVEVLSLEGVLNISFAVNNEWNGQPLGSVMDVIVLMMLSLGRMI